MPEAPEVRKYADLLAKALVGKRITAFSARTKQAKAWLSANEPALIGLKIEQVFARGKNIVGVIEDDFYFYSHQMMWGRWEIHSGTEELAKDRRERARITADGVTAILMSAPVFEIGRGDPLKTVPYLKSLGPDVLTYGEVFNAAEFRKRLLKRRNKTRTLGDVLLDQQIAAGIGNYLRAEIMFLAKLNPWMAVKELSTADIDLLCDLIPRVCNQAYTENGTTVTPKLKKRMKTDETLVYVPGKEYGTRHYVFRRTNLPCLICATPVKQLRQTVTPADAPPIVSVAPSLKVERKGKTTEIADKEPRDEDEEKSRIVYFCPSCQGVEVSLYARKR